MRSITGGCSSRNDSSSVPGDDEAAKQRLGEHVGARRLADQHGDLAEEVAAAEVGDAHLGDVHRRGALEDDVERAAAQPLAQDPPPGLERLLVERVGDPLDRRPRQVREEREVGELRDDAVSFHSAQSLTGDLVPGQCPGTRSRMRQCGGPGCDSGAWPSFLPPGPAAYVSHGVEWFFHPTGFFFQLQTPSGNACSSAAHCASVNVTA